MWQGVVVKGGMVVGRSMPCQDKSIKAISLIVQALPPPSPGSSATADLTTPSPGADSIHWFTWALNAACT
ncbi:Hypothetical protein NTJ_02306 [Nesidiocoris tenuis]|uniref:Uncharacterized protein n=1 Tax=Nesidiocoris tenuis TaxID=355587 RepID=A0ABN7AAZ6_9HEMI|nr:Hypothetical protein NTJ_02306 [Nesidiocoris tenuis]